MTSGSEAESAAITSVTAAPPLLEVRGASKQFGATRALDDVSLQCRPRRDRRAAWRERRRASPR